MAKKYVAGEKNQLFLKLSSTGVCKGCFKWPAVWFSISGWFSVQIQFAKLSDSIENLQVFLLFGDQLSWRFCHSVVPTQCA